MDDDKAANPITTVGGETTGNELAGEKLKRKPAVRSVVLLAAIVLITVLVFIFRDRIAQFAALGYPAIFIACFVLNSGVFGLSPSGLVAVEMSYVFDPMIVPFVAGLGAGLGEATSYLAGCQSTAIADTRFLDRFAQWGNVRIGAVAFVASFASGNLSDAVGVACGRLRRGLAGYMIGATAAKIAKMYLLVFVATGALGAFGITI